MNIQFGSVLNEQNSFVIWDEIGQGIFTVPKLPTWFRKHLRGSGSIDLKGFRSEKLNLTTWCCTRCFEGLSRSAFNNVKLKSLQAALGKEKQAEATMLGDNKQTLTPACHEQIENEANFAAGQMLFFQQAFVQNARDLTVGINAVTTLKKRYGNTITTTLWRYRRAKRTAHDRSH